MANRSECGLQLSRGIIYSSATADFLHYNQRHSETGQSSTAHWERAGHSNTQSHTKELRGGEEGRQWFELLNINHKEKNSVLIGEMGVVAVCEGVNQMP